MQEIELALFVKDKTLGYFYIYMPEHELANGSGKVYMHRYIAAMKIGRALLPNEHAHHKDGNKENNSPANIEVLLADVHAKLHMAELHPSIVVKCSSCGTEFKCNNARVKKSISGKLYCSATCRGSDTRKLDIDRELLLDLVWSQPTTKLAGMLGVSDVAIGKRCKLLGIPKPPRGYWAKLQ